MKELKRLLGPLKKKITINNLIYYVFRSALIGAALILAVLVSAKLVYVPGKEIICLCLAALSIIAGVFLALVKHRVTDYDAAEEGDRLGCDERLITAYGILRDGHEKTPMEELAVKDAVDTAKKARLGEKYRISFPRRLALMLCAVLAASCLTGFAPDAGVYVFTPTTKQALKDAEEISKAINKDEELSELFKEEYNSIIKDLNRKLKRAKDAKEARKLINEAQKELKKLENKVNSDKNNIKNVLSDFGAGNDISSAMDQNNSRALAEALKKLSAELENMTDEELKELGERLAELLEQLSDEELKELIEQAKEAAESSDARELASKISNAAQSAVQKSSSATSAVNRTATSLAQASDGTGTQTDSENQSSGNGSDGQGSGEGQGEDGGEGQGEGDGEGSGEGGGQGQGEGSGNGQGEGQGNGSGGGRGIGHVEPEKVFTRDAEELAGEDEQLVSQQTDDGEITYSETKAGGVNGNSVPYDSVIGDYMEQALKETESGDIPYGMKEIIAEYFSGLEK